MDNVELENKVLVNEENKEPEKSNKSSTIRYVLNISFVLIATALAIFFALKDDAREIVRNIAGADIGYLFVVIIIMVVCTGLRAFILFCFAHLFTKKYHFHQALAVDQIGVFYNAVTPGSSGGQFMQAYTYKTQGVHISSAVSILAMYSIVFQSILIIFGTISFIVKYDFINSLSNIPTFIKINDVPINFPVWPLTIIGFFLNVGVIAIVFLMGYWRGFHNFVMGPVVTLLHKIKLIKNPDKTRESLRIQVENFKIEFARLSTNIPFLILVIVSFVFYMSLKFCIPYFVGKALGNESQAASFWDSVFLSNYHQMITGLIPLPGSAGISEYVFYNLFLNEKNLTAGFFMAMKDGVPDLAASRSLVRSALVVWRSTTFVIPLLIGGIVAAFYRSSAREAKIDYLPNRQTFVSLQKETYVQRYEEVASLIETTRLSREAILDKLRPKKKTPVNKKKRKDPPVDISKQDYDEVILDDVESGKK